MQQGPTIAGGVTQSATGLPRLRVPFFKVGSWHHPRHGLIEADEAKLAEIQRNFRDNTLGRRPYLRIGHDSDDAKRDTFGDVKASGWVEDMQVEDGVLFAIVEPTSQEAVDLVGSKSLRYASAEMLPNFISKTDRTEKGAVIEAIGLTNSPFLTGLPDASVMLADRDGLAIALDYALPATAGKEDGRMSDKIEAALEAQTGILQKFTDFLMGGGKPPAAVVEPPKADDGAVELAEAQQAAETARQQLATERAARETAEKAAHATRVEAEATRLVALGIPPVQVAKLKPLLLAARGERGTIKLADAAGTETDAPLYDSLVALAEALPEQQRVKLGQAGAVESRPPGEQDTDPNDPAVQEKARKLAEQFAGMAGAKLADAPKANGTH